MINVEKIKYRKSVLLFVDITVYTILAVTLIISVTFDEKANKWLINILWNVTFWAVTIINYFAMRHINKVTVSLRLPGIQPNEKLRVFYVGFFGCAAIFNSLASLLGLLKFEDNTD